MLDNEINVLRSHLNELIAKEANYDDIYHTSLELDELISKYYTHGSKS